MPAFTPRLVAIALAALAVAVANPAGAVDPGDIVISELMIRSASAPEWIELHNPTAQDVDLGGCTIGAGLDVDTISALVVGAGTWAVLADDVACVAFDDAGQCAHPTDYQYSTLTLNDSGSETVELRCGGALIDAMTYTWPAHSADCVGADTCSVNLDPDRMTATDNDDWDGAWCVPPATAFSFDTLDRAMLATPGLANRCPASGDTCQVGDVVFSEIMIAPPTSTREWFEIASVGDASCDLHACLLREGPFADPFALPTSEDWSVHSIDAPGNSLPIGAGGFLLFAKSADTIVGDPTDPNETVFVAADYRYSAVGFSNSDPGYLHLICGGAAVDSVPFDWPRFEAACQVGACSVNLLPERHDPVTNDALDQWCLPPDDTIHRSSTGLPFTGTPGRDGACLQRPWPQPGGLLFTELMIAPDSGRTGASIPEWFELTNVSSAAAEVDGCRITRHRLDKASGAYAPTSTSQEMVFGTEADGGAIVAGASVVWSRNACLDGADPDEVACDRDERIFSGIEFSNSESERLDLLCPDGAGGEVLVDRAGYDIVSFGIRGAHTALFDPDEDDAVSLNDEAVNWCEASFADCYVTNGEGQCNYGTPGEVAPCEVGQVQVPLSGRPGCRCTMDARPSAALGWLAIGLIVLGRRRRLRE